MEQEVPIELHLQPPPVVLSRRMSRAYSSIAGDIRKAQDTDDNSLGGVGEDRAILRSLGGNWTSVSHCVRHSGFQTWGY